MVRSLSLDPLAFLFLDDFEGNASVLVAIKSSFSADGIISHNLPGWYLVGTWLVPGWYLVDTWLVPDGHLILWL